MKLGVKKILNEARAQLKRNEPPVPIRLTEKQHEKYVRLTMELGEFLDISVKHLRDDIYTVERAA